MPAFVESDCPITLVGGAPVSRDILCEALDLAPFLVAADGGAVQALAIGEVPRAVIGDMDSLPADAQARLGPETLLEIAEQDSTDFDKALRSMAVPLALAVGFTGARLDHELAVYNTLVRHPAGRVIVIGAEDLCFHAPRDFRMAVVPGTRVSLFPMAPVQGRSEGLQWPIDGLALAPDGRVGTSNRASGAEIRLSLSGAGMLTILPRGCLRSVVAALLAAQEGPGAPAR